MASANQSYAQSLYNSQKAQKALSRGGGGSNYSGACLVLCWYIITEVGSLFENAEKLGAKYPPFMKRIIEGMKSVVLKLSGHDEKDGE